MEDLMSNDEVPKSIGRNPKTQELEMFCLWGTIFVNQFYVLADFVVGL